MRAPDELKAIVEEYLEELELWPELHGQAESVRYAFVEMGGKRIRPVICLATGEAVGAEPEQVLPAAAALELVHNFSLVHDDLPVARRRRGTARQGERVGRVRRGQGGTCGRRAARGGVQARVVVPVVGGRARARGGDARDDRRPVPRHDGAGDGPHDGAPLEDRPSLLRVGDACARGRGGAGFGAAPVARVRRGARDALPGGRRHPRRRRFRRHARRRRRAAARGRRGGSCTGGARAGRRRHVGARRGSWTTSPCALRRTGA